MIVVGTEANLFTTQNTLTTLAWSNFPEAVGHRVGGEKRGGRRGKELEGRKREMQRDGSTTPAKRGGRVWEKGRHVTTPLIFSLRENLKGKGEKEMHTERL